MPFVIGLFVQSTAVSLLIIMGKFCFLQTYIEIRAMIEQVNISRFILEIMLGFLLFAGSLHTDWLHIKQQLKPITLFSFIGVILSTLIVAALFYAICQVFQTKIDFIYCLLFGALISPTDPIAVLGILTKANVPKKIETIIVGESLFNDGVGVVIFISLLETLHTQTGVFNLANFGLLFLQEAVGGVLFGLLAGFVLHKLLKSINHYQTEVLLTIAFVMAGYNICTYLHISGALAMVVMGLLVGNYKQGVTMSNTSQEYVNKFWEVFDVILNAILFIIIAFILVVIDFKLNYLLIGFSSIFIVLLSRILVIYLPIIWLPKQLGLTKKDARIIVWGGLRGGLSLALVLSLSECETKDLLLIATYMCVLFSIIIQGMTIEKVVKSVGLLPEIDKM
jgi:CPA1 family monovalent cation:H+ antiporter